MHIKKKTHSLTWIADFTAGEGRIPMKLVTIYFTQHSTYSAIQSCPWVQCLRPNPTHNRTKLRKQKQDVC